MVASLFATCSDGCGWAGAVVAPFAFGSFGVPLKTSVKVEVDPLVMQVSDSLAFFCSCMAGLSSNLLICCFFCSYYSLIKQWCAS